MARNKQAYQDALTRFNRVAGQLKRWHDIDPAEYLKGKTTAKGVQKALEQMRLDAEQENIQKRVEEYERAFEEAAKEADLNDKEAQYEQAREKIKTEWGIDFTETESDIFWNAFDDPDILDAFGSKNVLYMGEEVNNDPQITMKQAADIAKRTAAKFIGEENADATKIRNAYNDKVTEYKQLRKSGYKYTEAMDKLFK